MTEQPIGQAANQHSAQTCRTCRHLASAEGKPTCVGKPLPTRYDRLRWAELYGWHEETGYMAFWCDEWQAQAGNVDATEVSCDLENQAGT